jgi:DNA-binding response OmpR family regulator
MRVFVLGDAGPDLAAIENAIRLGQIDILAAGAEPVATVFDAAPYRFAGWTLDAVTRRLTSPAGSRVDLTSSEFDLLLTLVRAPGKPITRAALVSALKGRDWTYFDRSIDTLVARLRKKIDADGEPSLIRSVRSVGYVFCATVSRPLTEAH